MILRLRPGTPEARVSALVEHLEAAGVRTSRSPERGRPIVATVDKVPSELRASVVAWPEVEAVVDPVGEWRRVDRGFFDGPTVVDVGGVPVGGGSICVVAGPCSVENPDQVQEAAAIARRSGAQLLRVPLD